MTINVDAINALKNSKNVAIFVHVNPDGDCLGSASAVKQTLLKLGKNADIYCDDEISEIYDFIKFSETINVPTCLEYDLAVAVDCSDLHRMGYYEKLFKTIPNSVKFDHHKTYDDFAKINVVEQISSTCLILYDYVKQLVELDGDIACALYAGISSDTGCFMHSNTTHLEHSIASELLKFDFNLEEVNYKLFKRKSVSQMKLTKIAYNNVKLYSNNKLAIIALSLRDFFTANANRTHTLGLTDIVANLEGVNVGVLISEERKGLYSCSFRSNGTVDVSQLAKTFGGGGHERASGCNIFGHYSTVIKKITDAYEKEMKHNKK